ncbi:hypothetical protein FRC10_002737, partial [Ceratobasidium sp. 414]
MASNDFDYLVAQFCAYFNRDCQERSIGDLSNLLDRIFPPSRHRSLPDPPEGLSLGLWDPSSPVLTLSQRPPMLPRTTRNPADPDPLHGDHGQARNLSSASRASDGRLENVEPQPEGSTYNVNDNNFATFAANALAIPATHQLESQLHPAAVVAPPGNPDVEHLPAPVPFLGHDNFRPVLPPISQLATMTPADSQFVMHLPGTHLTTGFARPIVPGLISGPPVPPSTSSAVVLPLPRQPSFRHPSIAAHARTGSLASSYHSGSAHGHDQTITLASSVASTESLPTPGTSNSAYDIAWQPARSAMSSGRSAPSVTGNQKFALAGSTILDRSQYAPGARAQLTGVNPAPLRSPARGLAFDPRAASPPLQITTPRMPQQDVIMEASLPETPVGGPSTSAPSNDNQPDADEDDEPEEEPESEYHGARPTGARARPGGEPYVDPDTRAAIFADHRPAKHYRLCEYGYMVEYLFKSDVPMARLEQAMAPQSKGTLKPVFTEMASNVFENSRTPSSLHRHFKTLENIYRGIRVFSEHFSLGFDFGNQDLLETLARQIEELQARGIKLNNLHPWHLLVFVRVSWYFWMHTRLRNHPAFITSTDIRSGYVAPTSASSSIPAQAAVPPHTPTQAVMPSHPLQQPQRSSHLPPSTGSSRGRSKTRVGPPRATTVHDRSSQPPSSRFPASRNPPASVSSLRIPRDPPSGRSARKAHSAGGSAGTRQPKLPRSAVPTRMPASDALTNLAPAGTGLAPLAPTGPAPTNLGPAGLAPTGPAPTSLTPTGPAPTGLPPIGPAPTGPAPAGLAPTSPTATRLLPTGFAPTGLVPTGLAPTGLAPLGLAPLGFAPAIHAPTTYMPSEESGFSRDTESPDDPSLPKHLEMLRNQCLYQEELLAIKRQQVEQEGCAERHKIRIMDRAQRVAERQIEQRMRIERERAILDQVNARVTMLTNTWTAQHNIVLNTSNSINAQNPHYGNVNAQLGQLTLQPIQFDLQHMTNQARAQLTQPLGETANLEPAPHAHLAIDQPMMSATPGAGPSNHAGHLRGVPPTSSSREPSIFSDGVALGCRDPPFFL